LPRVAATADDQGHAGQLRTTQHLDGRDELVEVNMQHPGVEHAVHPTSLTLGYDSLGYCRGRSGRRVSELRRLDAADLAGVALRLAATG
jgi:hypothetical protein